MRKEEKYDINFDTLKKQPLINKIKISIKLNLPLI